MAFDIRKYLEDNKIELGKYETTESHNVAKGVSDIRKTQHEVHIVDGKFQLDTLKKVIVENKSKLNEGNYPFEDHNNLNNIMKGRKIKNVVFNGDVFAVILDNGKYVAFNTDTAKTGGADEL